MKKKNITAIGITLMILLLTAGCGSNKSSATEHGGSGEEVAGEKADVEEVGHLDAGDGGTFDATTLFAINEKGEKVGEFHGEKIKEILGLDKDNEDDFVSMQTCSDKIVICYGRNSEIDEFKLYAVNEGLGKYIELNNIPDVYSSVDYYNGDFYFTSGNKELICSIDDSLECAVKDANLGVVLDKVGNKTIYLPEFKVSITRTLDEVGYIIAYDSVANRHVMVQKDGTVTELPQLDIVNCYLNCYDKTGIVYRDNYYDDSIAKLYCINLNTMEETEIPGGMSDKKIYGMKNGKLYWSIVSEQDKSADILYEKVYYEYDVESNTTSVLAKTDVAPGSEYDIAFEGEKYSKDFVICGDNVFIKDVAEDKVKWFRIDKVGDNTTLADMELPIKALAPHYFDTAEHTWDKPILILDHNVFCPIDKICVGSYSEIILSDEEKNKYPKFAKYIEEANAKRKYDAYEDLDSHGEKDKDGIRCLHNTYRVYINVEFSRMYEHFVTLVENWYVDGGPHPNYFSYIFNVDLETGKELELSQILNDDSRLIEAVKKESEPYVSDHFTEEYNGSQKQSSFDEYLTDIFTNVIQKGHFDYCLTEEGLMFSFEDYDIARYADHVIYDITVKYSDYPELVKKEYVVTESKNPKDFAEHREVNETIGIE